MKIYFAGSIRGGRDDGHLYKQIISLLSKYGIVLTEHIGDEKLLVEGEKDLTDVHIYERDIEFLTETDVVIAEVSTPSLGVGYEIGWTESRNKKILCIYRPSEGKRLSAMIVGDKNLVVKEYQTIEDLEIIFKEFFK